MTKLSEKWVALDEGAAFLPPEGGVVYAGSVGCSGDVCVSGVGIGPSVIESRGSVEEGQAWVEDERARLIAAASAGIHPDRARAALAKALAALPPVERRAGDSVRHEPDDGGDALVMEIGVTDRAEAKALGALLLSAVEAWRATRETASIDAEKEEGGSQRARTDAMLRGRWSEIVRALAAGPEDG